MKNRAARQLRPSRQLTAFLCTLGILLLVSAPARADLVHGTVDLFWGAFDFSTQTQHVTFSNDVDIAWCQVELIDDVLCMWWGSGILAVPDTTLENITHAPVDFASYEGHWPPVDEQAYVVRTGDGFYVKLAVRQFSPPLSLVIAYYVQMDGTNNLRDDLVVTVEPTTWGRVKALYR